MAGRSSTTFKKRQKELARQDKQREKAAKKQRQKASRKKHAALAEAKSKLWSVPFAFFFSL